jgi:hypothetical protein
MVRNPGRLLWWILAGRWPASGGQLAALTMLCSLVLVGAVALAWPWLTDVAPRAVSAGLAVVQATLTTWLNDLGATLSAWLRQILAALPRVG